VTESRPLYDALQVWAGRKLAKKYGQERPGAGPLAAHWYPNRWGQEWSGLVEGADLDPYFVNRSPQWIVQQAEAFYVSMGFSSLSPSFWARSDLYPVPEGDARRKNAHASAWHVDLDQDIRSLMSVESDAQWFFTSHHELGHVYYFQAYSRPEVPPVLREGANRAFHEAVGELASLAAGQVPYLKAQGFLPKKAKLNPTQAMLVDALERTVVFLPWSAGVMSHFEYELYEKNLPPEQWQERWWEMVKEYQNMVPPSDRSDPALCDACTKTHINDDPASYYDYALATVIKYQLHEHIAKKILKQDPRSCNYYGNKQVGAYLKKILEQGATRDWRDILRDATGEELSTRAMMDYYKPLLSWLKQQNGS
jgi:peptidyl-dipeptidase A